MCKCTGRSDCTCGLVVCPVNVVKVCSDNINELWKEIHRLERKIEMHTRHINSIVDRWDRNE